MTHTFAATLVSGKIHLVQDDGLTAFTGSVKVDIFNADGSVNIVSSVGVTAGVSTTNFTFATLLNPKPNGTYYVSAIDAPSVSGGVDNKSHPTLTLTKTGTNAYSGATYVPPFTWQLVLMRDNTVYRGGSIFTYFKIAEGAHTFHIDVTTIENGDVLYSGNITTDSSGYGTVNMVAPGTQGLATAFAYQTDTLDVGATSRNTIGVGIMASTALGRIFVAKCTMHEPDGNEYELIGNGDTAAHALGELEAILALVDSRVTVVSAPRITQNVAGSDLTAFNTVNDARTSDGAGYKTAQLTFLQTFGAGTASQTKSTPGRKIRNVKLGYVAPTDNGQIDITATDIAAVAAAYCDVDGNLGYSMLDARFLAV